MKSTLRSLAYGVGSRLVPAPQGVQLILVYHGVSKEGSTAVTPVVFRDHLSYLNDVFEMVTVNRLVQSLGDVTETNRAAISFDDGYRNQFENALPVLEEFEVPGTFYVCPDRLGGRISTSHGDHLLMDRQQVREVSELGHQIGSHGTSHEELIGRDPAAVLEDVRTSRRELQELTGSTVDSFAYPWGRHDEILRRAIAEAGYSSGVTTKEAFIRADRDPMRLPRIGVDRKIGPSALRVKTSPWLPWVKTISRLLNRRP